MVGGDGELFLDVAPHHVRVPIVVGEMSGMGAPAENEAVAHVLAALAEVYPGTHGDLVHVGQIAGADVDLVVQRFAAAVVHAAEVLVEACLVLEGELAVHLG